MSEGRLEFVNGGWVASDEACPTFDQAIDNIRIGHKFLHDNFGIRPKHAWHIDAFGHSSAFAELFTRMGFETMTVARINKDEMN